MTPEELNRIVKNEQEWRRHTFKQLESVSAKIKLLDDKIGRIDKDLATSKGRFYTLVSGFGILSGFSAEYIKKLMGF